MSRLLRQTLAILLLAWLAGCAGMSGGTPVRLDETPRIAVISAFQPELTLLLSRAQGPRKHSVNGVEFTTGTLEGQPVVLFLSGISMTNAAMNTQLVLDRFNVRSIVYSGIAGGVNPKLHIGDVTVAAQWGQYLEVLLARETGPNQFKPPPWMKDATLANYGMLHPRPVEVRTAAQPALTHRFWFPADPAMLAAADKLRHVELAHCVAPSKCLTHKPQLVVGGNGVSGQAFVDNKAFREYAFQTFEANVLDMETAATAMVAYSNGVPYLAFRSLSDLAGGGEGENEMGTFMGVAADNSAKVLLVFLGGLEAVTVLALHGITKRFDSLLANDDISLTLEAGEVLALLGENGAGKSTLMSILFGHYTADAGSIEVFGAPLAPGNPRLALAAGVGMVHQHFTLADNLSVLDNVLMGTEPLWQPWSRRHAARARLLEVAQRFGLPVAPEALIGSLSVGERQRVEILKALYRGARILILDEPTAVLTPQESEALFATLAQMVAGGLAIIFISHKLPEVMRVSHRVAVLRNGRLVAQARTADTTQEQLALWMVGHAVEAPQRRPATRTGDVVCALEHVSTPADGRDALCDASLQLRAGEIVAIAGVSGNGQVALAELLGGVRRAARGSVQFMGRALPSSPARLVARGVARIPEDRHAVGVVGDLPVWENAVSERLRSDAFSRRILPGLRWVRRAQARAQARRIEKAFDVRGAGLDAPARSLSGGNMQKLILGRSLLAPERSERAPRLIVAHQPTWGLDIGAVAYVQQQLIAARDAGAAVLLISDDLDEVLALGDRVAVMHGGHIGEPRPAAAWTREAIGLAMAGTHAKAGA